MSDYCEISYDKNMQMLSQAIKYCEENFLHEDIINELYNDNDLKKQLCLIELSVINNQSEADILVSNLTEHSGPIRETTAFKILELIKQEKFKIFFQTKKIMNSFVKSITDINPSVSRCAIEIIKYADNSQYLFNKIVDELSNTLSEIEDINMSSHSYKSNKKNFSLYWNLEALTSLEGKINFDNKLEKILEKTALSYDYTIREKTAKAAKTFNLSSILKLLSTDDNIYVQKYLI